MYSDKTRCRHCQAQTQGASPPSHSSSAAGDQAAKNALLTLYVELGNVLTSPLLDLGPKARLVLGNLHAVAHAGLTK